MGLETGNYIADLVETNPPANDPTAQGDDHIRLLKKVLKLTFPQANKPIFFQAVASKVGNYTLTTTDGSNTILADTSAGAITFTLPALVSTDAGWEVSFLKTVYNAIPFFIQPASGLIYSGDVPTGLAKARRCIPGFRTRALWSGSNWYLERAVRAPLGAVIECAIPYAGGTAPLAGYEWPNGQTLSSAANYPEYFAVRGSGTTPDRRGRQAAGRDDMGGSAAGRLTGALSGGVAGTFEAVGGEEGHVPTIAEMVNHGHGGATGGQSQPHTHPYSPPTGAAEAPGGVPNFAGNPGAGNTGPPSNDHVHAIPAEGGGAAHNNMPPTIVENFLLVVE